MRSVTFRKQRHDATARILLDAAEAVLAEKGVGSTTMRDIAAKAGCAAGTIYLYFKTKQEVIDAIATHHSGILLGELDGVLALAAAPLEKLHRITDALVDYFSQRRSVLRILSAGGLATLESLPPAPRKAWEEFLGKELELIRRAQAGGTVRNDCPAEMIQQFMYIVIIGLRENLTRGGGGKTPAADVDRKKIWEFLNGGIGGVAKGVVPQKGARGAKK